MGLTAFNRARRLREQEAAQAGENNPLPTDTEDTPEPETGEPAAEDPAAGAAAVRPAKGKKPAPGGAEA